MQISRTETGQTATAGSGSFKKARPELNYRQPEIMDLSN
jgi:hypothetical protein